MAGSRQKGKLYIMPNQNVTKACAARNRMYYPFKRIIKLSSSSTITRRQRIMIRNL